MSQSQTTRVYFQQPIQGRHRQNVQLSNVNTTSSVLVTAAEYNPITFLQPTLTSASVT